MNDLRRRRVTRINITTKDKEEEKKKDDSTTAPILVLEGPVLSIEKQKVIAIPSFAGKKYQGQNIVTYVKAIDFTLNRLTDIKKVEEFRRLLSLTLDHNELTARSFEDVKLRRLENLSVAHNNIHHLENFIGNLIKGFPAIRQLNLQGNPCVPNKYVNPKQYQNYRYYVICKLPKLRVLDGQPVTPVELKRIQGKQIEPPLQLLEEQFVSPLEKDDLGFNSVKEGNLTIMKNKVIPNQEWDPKWFVLGERRLLCYTDEESSRNLNKPLKVIPLGGYQLQIGSKHVASRGEYWIFSLINSSKGKSYHFLVEDKNDLEDWKFCFKLQLVENVEFQAVRNESETPIVVISTEEEDLDSKQWDSIEDYQKAITQRELQIAHKRIEKLASFSLDAKDIELGEILGRGSFGVVHKGICRGKPVAVKKLHTQDLNPDALKDFANEIEIMTKIHHPHIILCMGACIEPGKLMIVTELMNTDLEQLITDQQRQLNLTTRLRMAKDAALGINWLHCSEPMIIHRDVKPSNFLIDDNLRVVVADFGLSEGIKKGASKWDPQGSFKGSLLFTSPEILKGAEFDEKSDVYSFGIVLWVLYTRELDPYPELAEITNQEYADKMIYEKYRPKIDEKCPPGLKKLMEDCWAPLQKDRPSFEHIIQRLESLVLELSISDLESREFWRKHYQDKEKVRWSDFNSKIEGLLGAPLEDKRDLSMLQAIFCGMGLTHMEDTHNPYVYMRRFGQIMDWFGPVEHAKLFLSRIRDLLNQQWFHGDINAQDSTIKLLPYGPGTFLVRFSFSKTGAFSLVYLNDKNELKNKVIQREIRDGTGRNRKIQVFKITYKKENKEYPTLNALIEDQPYLQNPCPGSQYVVLQRQAEMAERVPDLLKRFHNKQAGLPRASFSVKPSLLRFNQ